jgi:hypothetical protein
MRLLLTASGAISDYLAMVPHMGTCDRGKRSEKLGLSDI